MASKSKKPRRKAGLTHIYPRLTTSGWRWRPRIRHKGEVIWGPSFATQKEAYAAYLAMKSEAEVLPRRLLTLEEAMEATIDACEAKGGSAYTTKGYSHRFNRIKEILPPTLLLHEITPDDIRLLMRERRRKHKVGSNTIRDDLRVLHRMFRVAGVTDDRNPVRKVEKPKPKEPVRPFFDMVTLGQVIAKIRMSGKENAEYHADLIELIATTGIRNRELSRLAVTDVVFSRREGEGGTLLIPAKAGGVRELLFAPALAALLRRLIARATEVGSTSLMPENECYLSKVFRRWQKLLDEPTLTARNIRRSYATALHEVAPIRVVQEQMGHKNLGTTQKYLRARDTLKRSSANELHERLALGSIDASDVAAET